MDAGDETPWRVRVFAAVVCCLTWAWFGLSFVALSDSNPGGIIRALLVVVAVAIGIVHLLVLSICIANPFSRGWRWGIAGLLAAALIQVSWITTLPFQTRLWASDSALQQYAANLPVGRTDGGSAGLFNFEWTTRGENGAVYFVIGYSFKDAYGFVYLPAGASAHQPVEHVFGPWYRFDQW